MASVPEWGPEHSRWRFELRSFGNDSRLWWFSHSCGWRVGEASYGTWNEKALSGTSINCRLVTIWFAPGREGFFPLPLSGMCRIWDVFCIFTASIKGCFFSHSCQQVPALHLCQVTLVRGREDTKENRGSFSWDDCHLMHIYWKPDFLKTVPELRCAEEWDAAGERQTLPSNQVLFSIQHTILNILGPEDSLHF